MKRVGPAAAQEMKCGMKMSIYNWRAAATACQRTRLDRSGDCSSQEIKSRKCCDVLRRLVLYHFQSAEKSAALFWSIFHFRLQCWCFCSVILKLCRLFIHDSSAATLSPYRPSFFFAVISIYPHFIPSSLVCLRAPSRVPSPFPPRSAACPELPLR